MTTVWLLATTTPAPGELDPNDVSPGLLGFLVIFAVVLACIPLFLSMTGKLRRVEHSSEPGEAGPATSDVPAGAGDAPATDVRATDAPATDAAATDPAASDAASHDTSQADGPAAGRPSGEA